MIVSFFSLIVLKAKAIPGLAVYTSSLEILENFLNGQQRDISLKELLTF